MDLEFRIFGGVLDIVNISGVMEAVAHIGNIVLKNQLFRYSLPTSYVTRFRGQGVKHAF